MAGLEDARKILEDAIKAEEGMWLLNQMHLIEKEMQNKGLGLSKEEIYNINNSSIKDEHKV